MIDDRFSTSSQMQTAFTSLSHSASSNSEAKYGGLVDSGLSTIIRKDMIQLFAYIYAIAPSFSNIHNFMTIIRILQFFGPSLCVQYKNVWDQQSSTTLSILSLLFHVFPKSSRESVVIPFLISYCTGLSVFLVFLQLCSIYFKKNASLPSVFTTFISFFFALFGHMIYPIATQLAFESLSNSIFGNFVLSDTIMLIVLTILVTSLYFWVLIVIVSQNMMFRPDSLLSVSLGPPLNFLISTVLVTAIFAFNTYTKGVLHYVLHFAGSFVYLVSTIIPLRNGGFVNISLSSSIIATSLSGFFISFLVGITILFNRSGTMILVFAILFFWFLAYLVSRRFLDNVRVQHLEILDTISNNQDCLDDINSTSDFINIIVSGFSVAHPSCLSWDILRIATEKWPREQDIWYVFGKFASIYPEETQILSWIFHSIKTGKIKGMGARAVKEQSISITRQREMNLSPSLKEKLAKISKQIDRTKHKLRHVWDVVIQGNIGEVESATKRANESIEKDRADFLHLLRRFPNNRFVMRAYSRFLIEITADVALFNEAVDKTRLLHRGIMVTADQSHELGLSAYPNLPDKLRNNTNLDNNGSKVRVMDFDSENDEILVEDSHKDVIKKMIDELTIPSIKNSILMRFFVYMTFFVFIYVILLVIVNLMILEIEEPLGFMYNLATIRNYVNKITGYSNRYVFEVLGIMSPSYNGTSYLPSSLGSSWDIRKQLVFIMSMSSSISQSIGSFRTFNRDNPIISKAQHKIFGESINYSLFINPHTTQSMKTNLQGALMEMILQSTHITKPDSSNIIPSIINTSYILNVIHNSDLVIEDINFALSLIKEYIASHASEYSDLAQVLLVVMILIILVAFFGSLIWELKIIRSNKNEAYYCLTSLPKNTVSSLAENIRVLKKDSNGGSSSTKGSTTGDAEMSKQEENILKIFNTGGSGTMTFSMDSFIIALLTFVIVGLNILASFLVYQLVVEENSTLSHLAPHLDNLPGSYSMILNSLYSINLMAQYYSHVRDPLLNFTQILNRISDSINKNSNYFSLTRYGSGTEDNPPFIGFQSGLSESIIKSACSDEHIITADERHFFHCQSPDYVFIGINNVIGSLIAPIEDTDSQMNPKDGMLSVLWEILIYPLYETFFYPMFEKIIPTINDQLMNLRDSTFPIIIYLVLIAGGLELLALMSILSIKNHIKFVLGLLMHCSTGVTLQTQRIMKVLSGDFSSQQESTATRDSVFYDSVFENLPDAIMVIDSSSLIDFTNKSFKNLFKNVAVEKNDYHLFLDSVSFVDDISQAFESVTFEKKTVFLADSDAKVSIHIMATVYKQKRVLTFRDITQSARYNTLIREEKMKSDALLASILPASMVKRVQSGEKNISFAIQSVSIVFIDIVSFTPWCSSVPASVVMRTLNALFKKFDTLISMYPTMTKIKCIGDCYMAAGGVFLDVNQPAIHAKEAVSFGLDTIDSILEINQELNQSLEIRVGIATGGPIIGGVLGVGKPTFEILGPAINMAQQMEHNGIPMKVHISRSVYELIYGEVFEIKERGKIDIKGGSAITYLVTRQKPNSSNRA